MSRMSMSRLSHPPHAVPRPAAGAEVGDAMTDRAVLLESLLADPSRATQVPRDEAVALLVELMALQAALVATVSRPAAPVPREAERPTEDRMLEVGEAAALLGVTP